MCGQLNVLRDLDTVKTEDRVAHRLELHVLEHGHPATLRSIRMELKSAIPVLRIFNEEMSREFYLEFLGFKVDWEARFTESSPIYMQISKDGCVLRLSGHFGDCCPGGAACIEMRGVREYSELLSAKNYKHARPGCQVMDWGTLEMSIKDPSGNKLTFWEPVPQTGG
jgi:hypothetical protein